jgi:DNA polymerase/3'-5' exonuclease PolX
MNHADALRLALDIVRRLRPACHRIAIAGSIRRHERTVNDIDIVYIPRMVDRRINLFDTAAVPATADLVSKLARDGYWNLVTKSRPDPRYTHAYLDSYVSVDLYRAERATWGALLAIRTGPKTFNQVLVNRTGGAMPADMVLRGAHLWRRTQRLHTPTETRFFREIGIPWWTPRGRTARRLGRFLSNRAYRRHHRVSCRT